MGNHWKNMQSMLVFLKAQLFGPTLFLLHVNDLLHDIICNIHSSDLWQQLKSASEIESDLQDSMDRGRTWKNLFAEFVEAKSLIGKRIFYDHLFFYFN